MARRRSREAYKGCSATPHPWHATLRGRIRVRVAGGGAPPPGPQQGEALVLQAAGYQAILLGPAGGYRSHILAGSRCTVARGIPAPAPCRLAAGAHPGLLYVGGPLAASSPATHRQRP